VEAEQERGEQQEDEGKVGEEEEKAAASVRKGEKEAAVLLLQLPFQSHAAGRCGCCS